jgi:hypothetical protein
VTWIATGLSLLGAALVAARRPALGQLVWIPANTLWVAWGIAVGEPSVVVLFSIYWLLAVAGVANYARARGGAG